ncbi:MAG: transposase [Oscillospiraceae bacterium]
METERKDFRMFSLEERERAVELYFTTPMTTAQVVEHLGYPTRQCLERWLAMDSRYAGHMAKPIIPLETRRRAVELVLGGMQQKQAAKQLGVSVGAVHGWVRAYRKGGMAALQPKNRNSAQGNKPAGSRRWPSAADDDDAEALRRRVEELELENALMREVVEVVKKDPGADLRRLSNREKTLSIDRLRPAYSLSSMTCLLAIAPSSYHYHHARLGVDKYAGLRAEVAEGVRRFQGQVRVPQRSRRCSRPAYRRRWSAGSWRRKGSWRTCPSDAGIVPTRARRRRLPPISSTGTSRPSVRTRSG